jgi:hypothetical protein
MSTPTFIHNEVRRISSNLKKKRKKERPSYNLKKKRKKDYRLTLLSNTFHGSHDQESEKENGKWKREKKRKEIEKGKGWRREKRLSEEDNVT